MNPQPRFALHRDRALPRWGLVGLSAFLILGGFAYFALSRSPGVTISAREDTSSGDRSYLAEVRASPQARQIDLPRLGVRATLREGRGQFRIRAVDLPMADGPLSYVLREPWYGRDHRGSVLIAGLPAIAATDPVPASEGSEPAPEASPRPGPREVPGGQASPGPSNHPAPPPTYSPPASGEASAGPNTAEAPYEAPQATPPPPVHPRSAWARDRALESELAGRGVAGVRILRHGRSIRLRGTAASDKALRTVYQFMNDKGFGEVDYGVEVR